MRTLLIIPAFNEEANILKTYNTIIEYNHSHNTHFDVIVINDGSTDNTLNICKENNIPVISLIHNLGIGGAVQTGYKYAYMYNYDIAVQYDGDGQHDVRYVDDITKPLLNNEVDFVVGSRFVDESSSEFKSTMQRRMGIKLISSFIKFKTGKRILDTTSGFRAINKNIICEFAHNYPTEYPEPITNARLLKQGYRVKEVPVAMHEREGGESSIKASKAVYYMLNVLFGIITL